MNNNLPVGIFDSGVGGLTVVKEVFKQLPHESIIYFGDTARVPYGNKSKKVVQKFSVQILNFLLTQKVKVVVMACNTASAYALDTLRNKTGLPVIDVIEPGAKKSVELTRNNKIGIIGTEGTIRSQAYVKAIRKYSSKVKVFSQPCPLFVPLVEEGWAGSAHKHIVKEIAEKYLKSLKQINVDTLILGCTHYPWLENIIAEVMGKKVKLVSSAYETANFVKDVMKVNNILSNNKQPRHKIFVSDSPQKIIAFGKKYAVKNMNPSNVKNIDIEKY